MGRVVHKLSSLNESDNNLIFGISSHENDYRICWAINQQTQLLLTKTDDLSIVAKSNTSHFFSNYEYKFAETRFRLIANRCDNGFLLKEYKNFDFILVVENPEMDFDAISFVNSLKASKLVTAVLNIGFDKLKNKKRLF